MATFILDNQLAMRLQRDRVISGSDRYDEVWEGTYMMAPAPNNEHQGLVNGLAAVLQLVIVWEKLGKVFPGCNVSDREVDWTQNYRVPDLAVFLNGASAIDCGEFWLGGPDFAVEVISPEDQSRKKFSFYAKVNTRELLLIDRDPWQLELYRLQNGEFKLVATGRPNGDHVESDVIGLSLQLRSEGNPDDRPLLEIKQHQSGKCWAI